MAAPTSYQPGYGSYLFYAPEVLANYPGGNALPSPAQPTGAVFAGFVDVPEVVTDEGSRAGYSIGTGEPSYIIPGRRMAQLSTTARIANLGLIGRCFYGGGQGLGGLPDTCLFEGSSDSADGFGRAIRYAKPENVAFNFQTGEGQELTAQLGFRGIVEEAATKLAVTNTDLGAYGTPLTSHNLTQVNFASNNWRHLIESVTFQVQYQLDPKGCRPDYGPTNAWSRTPYAFLAVRTTYNVTYNFHDPDMKNYALGQSRTASNSATAIGAQSLVVTDAGSSTQGTTANGFTLAAAAGRIGTSTRRGGDSGQELTSSFSAIVSGVTFTPLASA